VRTVTVRELNRTLLARQLLTSRRRMTAVEAVERLVALQAQYAPSPYVALWSRLQGLQKSHVTDRLVDRSLVKAAALRGTLHVMSRNEFPHIAAAAIDSRRGRTERLGVHVESLQSSLPDGPFSAAEAFELGHRVLRTDDRWTVAFALRAIPFVRGEPVGPWPHTKPSRDLVWREPLPDAAPSSVRVIRQYIAAYGPASREDIAQFTFFRLRQIDPALDGLRTLEDEEGRTLFDLPRARVVAPDAPAPPRFLPAFDSILLAHRDRSRIVPADYVDAVFNRKNATTKQTFTVDGFVAGSWRVQPARGGWRLDTEPFAPLPVRVRRDVEAEGARLVAFYES
jgi:Winged helix DNA-binding domain